MATDEEMHNALVAIYSRLGVIDGKTTLLARANRESVLNALEEVVTKRPLIGQIYLLLDGSRTQRQIRAELKNYGVDTSEATISRRMDDLAEEHGIAVPVDGAGGGKVYRKSREMEDVLNLSKNVREWLRKLDKVVPEEPPARRPRRKR